MRATLTQQARHLYGDEHTGAVGHGGKLQEIEFVEELTFADADAILAMLHELSPHVVDGALPVWVRNLAYRLVLLQRPAEPALMREAADSLYLHGPDWDDIAADLRRRADTLDAASR